MYPLGGVVRREVYTGLLVGVTLAAVFFPIGLWRWGDASMVAAVALAILAACTTASAVALTLPWLFNRLGLDPAFGSGPLATVIQDLLSVIIYLRIATAMLGLIEFESFMVGLTKTLLMHLAARASQYQAPAQNRVTGNS